MEITWEVEDGYMGGSRPQTTTIDDGELLDCETTEERKALIGCYNNHVTTQGRFYPKIYYIIWELYTEKNAKKPTAQVSVVSVDNKRIMRLRKITTY